MRRVDDTDSHAFLYKPIIYGQRWESLRHQHGRMAATPFLVQRTIHPVGQGGFVTEQLCPSTDNGYATKLFKVVYDCGSSTVPNTSLRREIKRTFDKGEVIELLFISHLDDDHINGISQIRKRNVMVEKLVLPLMNCVKKIFAFFDTGKKINFFNTKEIEDFFGAKQVIFIDPISLQSLPSYQSTTNIVSDGAEIYVDNVPDWIYLVFNVCDDDKYSLFESLLQKDPKLYEKFKKLQSKESLNADGQYFSEAELRSLNKIYKEVGGNTRNNESLVVYSGPCDGDHNFKTKAFKASYYTTRDAPKMVTLPGTVYTGDIDFNKKLGGIEVRDILKNKMSPVINNIGMVQIPHHGSRNSFNIKIINSFSKANTYFCCYGTTNAYGHPADDVRLLLLANRKNCFEVTEEASTVINQIIVKVK